MLILYPSEFNIYVIQDGGYKLKRRLSLFLLGAICFIVSQPLLRIPILNYLQGKTGFILFYRLNPLLVGILIAFSAGIFEEGFRFLFKGLLLKSVKLGILEPIIFGLGHGLAEALIILLPYLSIVPLKSLYMGIIERILAIILHIGLTVIIWNGFQLDKRYKFLGIAILIHGFINSLIPVFNLNQSRIILIEVFLVLIDILLITYILKSKKYYFREEKQ